MESIISRLIAKSCRMCHPPVQWYIYHSKCTTDFSTFIPIVTLCDVIRKSIIVNAQYSGITLAWGAPSLKSKSASHDGAP